MRRVRDYETKQGLVDVMRSELREAEPTPPADGWERLRRDLSAPGVPGAEQRLGRRVPRAASPHVSAGCVSSPLPLPYWFVWSQERFCGAQTGRWEMMGLF